MPEFLEVRVASEPSPAPSGGNDDSPNNVVISIKFPGRVLATIVGLVVVGVLVAKGIDPVALALLLKIKI
ncbi:hypothetical protein [Nonomuraea dietziae]|uniref:hypothetical protein n=1 Tax=Nonomuraea dietziae TaxID=65515 RepID=UPI0033FE8D91